jgi:aminocarboxymuconate-semialdehyde decarboxylase
MTPAIDVHTHCLTKEWFDLLQQHGGPRYTVREVVGGLRAIHLDGAPFMTPVPAMFDYDMRIKAMNENGVGVSVLSLTCPNVFWGGKEISLKAAQIMNDDMAQAQTAYKGRIEWFASLPWQYPDIAPTELDRACKRGAKGVMVLANIDGKSLTDPQFAPIWQAIDARNLPVLVHPTAPPGVGELDMNRFQLTASIGFTFDTTLALARMIFDGFFDAYPRLKIIGAHGGGTLPFLIARMDQCFDNIPACREKIIRRPSEYLHKIYVDAVLFSHEALAMTRQVMGDRNILYGSDYPHTIGDMPGTMRRVSALPPMAKRQILGNNARMIFGL